MTDTFYDATDDDVQTDDGRDRPEVALHTSPTYRRVRYDDGSTGTFEDAAVRVVATDAVGRRWHYRDTFDDLPAAERFIRRVEEAGGRINAAMYWVETDPAYGSAAYMAYDTEQQYLLEEMNYDCR